MLTRDDARLVRALARLAKYAPESMRAGHLVEKAERLADRIEQEAFIADEVLRAFADPTEVGRGG